LVRSCHWHGILKTADCLQRKWCQAVSGLIKHLDARFMASIGT